MPDASHPFPNSAAHDWSGAFNALPPEAPPADGWARLATRLDARRKPRRVAAWVGLAAAAAVVAVIAWPRESPVAGTTSAGAMEVASQEAVIPREAAGSDNSVAVAADPTRTDVAAVAAAAAPARKDVVASTVPAREVATPVEPTQGRLYRLQQESARLEALLAVARDERVTSASAVLLADAFDTQVASIDAALAAPELVAGEREQLWQARVDALQQAAGFEGTQRLLAVGGHADALLVAVD